MYTLKPDGELGLISNSLRVIRSRTDHVLVSHATPDVQDQITLTYCIKSISFYQALYRQSDAQRKLYQRHGNVLVVHLHYGSSFSSKKTLLAISVIDDEDGADYTVCLITLPDRILFKVIACCFEIFTSVICSSLLKYGSLILSQFFYSLTILLPLNPSLLIEKSYYST